MGICASTEGRLGSSRVRPTYARDGVAIVTTSLVMGSFMGHAVINQYLAVKDLGSGAHGVVQLCVDTNEGRLYAMKVVNKRRQAKRVMNKGGRRRSQMAAEDEQAAIAAKAAAMASGALPGEVNAAPDGPPPRRGLLSPLRGASSGALAKESKGTLPAGGSGNAINEPLKKKPTARPSFSWFASLTGRTQDAHATALAARVLSGTGAGGMAGRLASITGRVASMTGRMASMTGRIGSSSRMGTTMSTDSHVMEPLYMEAGTGRTMSALDMGGDLDNEVFNEIQIMQLLDHPHLTRLHEVIQDPEASQLVFIVEFADGGPTQIKQPGTKDRYIAFGEQEARDVFCDMVLGVQELQRRGMVHGDIKPENTVVTVSGFVKIIDFGSAKSVDPDFPTRVPGGTPAFMAPECCATAPYLPFPSEVWALGVSLYLLIYGRVPFAGKSLLEVYQQIQADEVHFPSDVPVSDDLQSLVGMMLRKDPLLRPSVEEILEHPWVAGHYNRNRSDHLKVSRITPVAFMGCSALAAGASTAELFQAWYNLDHLYPEYVKTRVLKHSEVLIRPGEPFSGCLIVLDGTLNITHLAPEDGDEEEDDHNSTLEALNRIQTGSSGVRRMELSRTGTLKVLSRSKSGRRQVKSAPTPSQLQVAAYVARVAGKKRVAMWPEDDQLHLRLVQRPQQALAGFTLRRPTGYVLGHLYAPGADIPPRGGVEVRSDGKTRVLMISQADADRIILSGSYAGRTLLYRLQLECEFQELIDKFVGFGPNAK